MAQRTSFRKIAVAAKEQEHKRRGLKTIMSTPNLDYTLELTIDTHEQDENGEVVKEYFKSPFNDKLGDISNRLELTRSTGVAEGIYKVIGATLTREMWRNYLKDTYILITLSIKYGNFKDELAFSLDAGRDLKGVIEELLVRILRVLNKSITKDELQVKWWLMKVILSGRKPKGKEGNMTYAHGYKIDEGIHHNRVHGYYYKHLVLMNNTAKSSSRYTNTQEMHYKQDNVEWVLTNYVLRNLDVISNTEFQMLDNRTRKGTFFGVKYEVGFQNKLGDEKDLRLELERRWGFNNLESITVILCDLMPKLTVENESNIREDLVKLPYYETLNDFFELNVGYSGVRGVRGELEEGLIKGRTRLKRVSADMGIYKTVNYHNLFSEFDGGENYKYRMGVVQNVEGNERIEGLRNGNIILKGNSTELFQFLYLHDTKFKQDVDNYYKSYKEFGVELFIEVLGTMQDYNISEMLLEMFRPAIKGNRMFDLPF